MTAQDLKSAEDLVVRGRRGLLSEKEQRELDRALEGSAALRVAQLLGLDIDRATAVQSGDEAVIASAVDRVLAGIPPLARKASQAEFIARREKKRRRAIAVIAVCATLCAAGVAAAALGVPRVPASKPPVELQKAMEHAQLPTPAGPRPVERSAPRPNVEGDTPKTVPSQTRVKQASAAQLFHDANTARRSGESRRAKRLYSQLIERHPNSDEASLARVSLGKLLLERGEPLQAEEEFRRYLSKGGQLAEEALLGRAESLGQMKRPDQERQAWQDLLSRYPNSVYAPRARDRISALGSKR